jgi:hypothetical protein
MESSNRSTSATVAQRGEPRKPYHAPVVQRLSPERVKELIARNGDTSDLQWLDRIEKIQRKRKKIAFVESTSTGT